MTPYELRFEIFKQSYNMLNDEYCVKYDLAREWKLEYPNFPTYEQVEELANKINSFVSSK